MDYWLHVHEENGEIRAKKEYPIRKARWLDREKDWYECSYCGTVSKQWVKNLYKYCPYCGCSMEERKQS